ncbi:MAG: TolC family protein, partial [Gammaproteobacteria bacterium]|nr:TolC family protein [Gammaproteobacteria bacterium]
STDVAVGIPAELLRRRPDVKRAELQAAAQSAIIGVAKADLYPSFALFGSIGLAASSGTNTTRTGRNGFDELLDSDSLFFVGGPTFNWPIFNYGRIRNNVRVQDARLQQLLVNYQNTVLRAAQEAEDSMTAFLRSSEEVGYRIEGEKAALRAVDLALIQYREGATDYTTVLNTQQTLVSSQDQLTAVRGDVAQSLIGLYKSLGGGWQIRQGKPILPEATKEEMRQRTNWGRLLDPNVETQPATTAEPRRSPDW